MRGTLRNVLRGIVGLALLAVTTTCTDQTPVTSPNDLTGGEITEPANNVNVVTSVTCTADVEKGEVTCGDVPVVDETGAQRVIVGGQGIFVQLISTGTSYNGTTEVFQTSVRIGNIMPLGLGSADGLSVTGVKVFHHTAPVVTVGTGTVTVKDPDGTGTFTGANQPYFEYLEYIPGNLPGLTAYGSQFKTWEWFVPSTALTFTFEVYVSADVVNPDGFVLMDPPAMLFTSQGQTATINGTIRDHVGRDITGGTTVLYTSSDPTVATVGLTSGLVTAVAPGVAEITGSGGSPYTDGITRVTIPQTGAYEIDFHFLTTITPSQQQAFTDAATKWASVITGDLATELVDIPILACGGRVYEYVDDLTINVLVAPIDGVGGTLGFAAPCWIRSSGSLPAFGFMQFDLADVANLEANNQLDDVVLHEMGHVLGVGTLWDVFGFFRDSTGVLDDCPATPNDPYFAGLEAIAAFDSTGGGTYTGGYKVPAEDGFGDGTRCYHWRESILDNELMTGFAEAPGTTMPLSAVTAKSLLDMGYTLGASTWDPFTCPSCSPPAGGAPRIAEDDGGFELVNDVLDLPLFTRDATGQVIEVRPGGR